MNITSTNQMEQYTDWTGYRRRCCSQTI